MQNGGVLTAVGLVSVVLSSPCGASALQAAHAAPHDPAAANVVPRFAERLAAVEELAAVAPERALPLAAALVAELIPSAVASEREVARAAADLYLRLAPSDAPEHVVRAALYDAILLLEAGDAERAYAALHAVRTGLDPDGPLARSGLAAEWFAEAALVTGRSQEALDGFAAMARAATQRNDVDVLTVALTRMAWTLVVRGELSAADEASAKALALLERATSSSPATRTRVLKTRADVLAARRSGAEAEALYEQALSCAPDARLAAPTLGALVQLLLDQGRIGDAARRLHELERLALAPAVSALYRLDIAQVQGRLAEALGDTEAAARAYEQLRDLSAQRGDDRTRIVAALQLAQLTTRTGDRAAVDGLEGLLATAIADGHDDLATVVLQVQAQGLAVLGEHEEALARWSELEERLATLRGAVDWAPIAARQGAAIARFELGTAAADVVPVLERAVEDYVEAALPLHALYPLRDLARVHRTLGDADALQTVLRRSEALLDAAALPDLATYEAAGARSAYAEWAAYAQDLVALRRAAGSLDALHEGLRQAWRWKGRMLFEALGRRSSVALADEPASLLEVLAANAEDDTLYVEYVAGHDELFAYVLRGGRLDFVDLGERAGLEKDVQVFVRGLAADEPEERLPLDAVAALGRRLQGRLLAPLLAADVTEIVVCPTAELARLPFEALVLPVRAEDGKDGPRFVLDAFTVSYAPSLAVLARLAAAPPRERIEPVLIVADALGVDEFEDAGARSPDPADPALPGTRLPESRGEALNLARLLATRDAAGLDGGHASRLLLAERARSTRLSSPQFELCLGAQAATALLQEDLSRYGALYLAVHGVADPTSPWRSSLVLSPAQGVSGRVSLADITRLGLRADLVVLSACETADGPIVRGEGIQSLLGAFLEAGARGGVASLWTVLDRQSADTMRRFHEHWIVHGLSPARALVRAKRDLRALQRRGEPVGGAARNDLLHPHVWAPFIFVGADRAESTVTRPR